MNLEVLTCVIIWLAISSTSYCLPLPRMVYQTQIDEIPQFWVLRPASMSEINNLFEINSQVGQFNSYLEGKFDPDRPYIQLVVTVSQKKIPGGVLEGPTPPPPETTTTVQPIFEDSDAKVCNDTNATALNQTLCDGMCIINGTNDTALNKVWCYAEMCIINGTNTTALNLTMCHANQTQNDSSMPTVVPVQPLFMLADGKTLYLLDNTKNQGSLLEGAYELAYVSHQRTFTPLASTPYIQFADYNPIQWSSFYDRMPFVGNDPYSGYAYSYQPVYTYKPVYPSVKHNYDVYQYFPVDRGEGVGHQSQQQMKEHPPPPPPPPTSANSLNQGTATESKVTNSEPNSDTQKASEITMPNGVTEEISAQETALVNALISQIEPEEKENEQLSESPVQPEEEQTTEVDMEQAEIQKLHAFEEELKGFSDEDLINAVEEALLQLQSRLID